MRWIDIVNSVHTALIKQGVSIEKAKVGDFEFGGLDRTEAIKTNVDKNTGAIVIVDAKAWYISDVPTTAGVKPSITWREFANHIEETCLKHGILPSDIAIEHLEIRPKSVDDLSIFVDTKFNQLSITDGEDRINGSKLGDLLDQ